MLGKLIRFFMFFLFIFTLVSRTKMFVGYTMNQSLIFFLTFNVIDTMTQLTFREVYRFRSMIVNGDLDGVLLKPYHPFLRVLVGGVDFMDLLILVLYIVLLVFFILQSSVVSPLLLGLYLVLIVNSMLLATGFHILVLALGIVSTEVDHTIMIYRDLSKMAVVPIDIYKEPIRSLITFVIPVGVMMTFPVKGLLGLLSFKLVGISFALGLGVFFLSLFAWKRALAKYQSVGS